MTISTETAAITIIGDGANTTFTYDFLIPYQADGVTPAVRAFVTIDDVVTDLVLDTDYYIAGVADPDGGEVTYPVSGDPLVWGATITILRDEAYVQPYAFLAQGFNPVQVGAALDWIVMQTQQLNYALGVLEARVAALEE